MKIALVVSSDIPDGGAVAHRILMMSKGLVSLGHEVHILAPYRFRPGPLSGELDGIIIHWGAFIKIEAVNTLAAKIKKRYLLYRNLKGLLEQKLDWLILYDMGVEGLPFLLLAKHYGCMVASENCDIFYLTYKESLTGIIKDFLKNMGYLLVTPHVDLNFAISIHIQNYLKKVAPGVPQLLVRAPVDLDRFRVRASEAEAFRTRRGLENVLVVGYCGGAWAVKGLELLLRAIKILKAPAPFKLLITGRSAGDVRILQLVEELELKDKVIFTGHIPHDELIIAMSAADILVEPKIDHDENLAAFPQKIVEYLSMGKPIVASAVGDLSLYLHDQENALLCRPGDAVSLAKTLERLMSDGALRGKLSKEARRTAIQYFDCRRIAKNIEVALTNLQESKRSIQK